MTSVLGTVAWLLLGVLLLASGCSPDPKGASSAPRGDSAAVSSVARPAPVTAAEARASRQLTAAQDELLELAFATATKIPVAPHIKDRSRSQAAVVAVCLELDQPERARLYNEKIDNWRRGLGHAQLAFYFARHGRSAEVPAQRALAEEVAKSAEDWRKDFIKAEIAKVEALRGPQERAARTAGGAADVEATEATATTATVGVRALLADENSFDEVLKELEGLLAAQDFESIKSALESCAVLFDRFCQDQERRDRVETRMRSSWGNQPLFIRIELLMKLARSALDHRDQATALKLVDEAGQAMDGARWPAGYHVQLRARLAALRHQAGDTVKARLEVEAAVRQFDEQRQEIVNIERAGCLRPVAEAYQAMGDKATALAVYKRAVAEGLENPNSRPRAEDLSTTCCSMARHGVEPDAALWSRIRQISASLSQPW